MRRFLGLPLLVMVSACTPAPGTPSVTSTLESSALSTTPGADAATTTFVGDGTDVPSSSAPFPATTLQGAIALLRVENEHEGGYKRDLFRHWVDSDGDGCDTRCEVLAEERLPFLPGLVGGGWLSTYDGYSTDDPGELDIDHLVPLAEAYASGAYAWDARRREEFANDLGNPSALIAVTAATNRSKGASDPAEWQPPRREYWCVYVTDWVTVKLRWDLSADPTELRALTNMAAGCEAPFSTPQAAVGSPPLVDAGDRFANCSEARAAGRAPLRVGDPGYRPGLDRDGDGIACE